MDPLVAAAPGLEHVSVLQGTTAYGAHVHALAVPARESQSRGPHENFYWLKKNYIRALQAGAACTFTIWRPQVKNNQATSKTKNLIPILGLYAAICRELG